jgi:hypothetical protein
MNSCLNKKQLFFQFSEQKLFRAKTQKRWGVFLSYWVHEKIFLAPFQRRQKKFHNVWGWDSKTVLEGIYVFFKQFCGLKEHAFFFNSWVLVLISMKF